MAKKGTTKYSGDRYEKRVAHRMTWMGFYAIRVCGKSGDMGADVTAIQFPFCKVVVQCKHYSGNVGVEAVQQVVTAREYYRAHKAIIATNSTLTKRAKELAHRCGVEVWERFE